MYVYTYVHTYMYVYNIRTYMYVHLILQVRTCTVHEGFLCISSYTIIGHPVAMGMPHPGMAPPHPSGYPGHDLQKQQAAYRYMCMYMYMYMYVAYVHVCIHVGIHVCIMVCLRKPKEFLLSSTVWLVLVLFGYPIVRVGTVLLLHCKCWYRLVTPL